jgi:hypothetical protein
MMEKLLKEAIPTILPVKQGRETKLRKTLMELNIGEGLFMPKTEWTSRSSPAYVVARLKKTHKLRFEYGMKTDGTGWIFRRLGWISLDIFTREVWGSVLGILFLIYIRPEK